MLLLSPSAVASSIIGESANFSSTAGLERTCRGVGRTEQALVRDEEKIAFALCNGIALLRDGARWMRELRTDTNLNLQDDAVLRRIRAQLEDFLLRIRVARQALEGVRGAGPYMLIKPGEWEIDLDGDGAITPQEKYFFWVPKRGLNPFSASEGPQTPAYYEMHFVPPVIRVDRSDVYWAIAYCQFAEAALNLVLSYDMHSGQNGLRVELKNRSRIAKTAYKHLLEGLRYSTKLREALALETDDDSEWIPNPKQTDTSFPIVMDAQTFSTWGTLLEHLTKLFRGETLLGGGAPSREFPAVRDLTMGLCQPGEGINLRSLFLNPIQQPLDSAQWRTRCVKPDARVAFSGLAQLIEESIKRNSGREAGGLSGEWMILRHLYWVN